MKLQQLRLEQIRQFRDPLLLGDLQPGINLIHGPNESGKSTLVRAIRAAFFERHRSKSVEDLRPWGDSAAVPTVELAFEHNQRSWRLTKSFLQRKRCDLVVDGTSYSGDEAEEKLAALLGYQLPQKGASKEQHWGVPGLLWVEQGTGQDIERAVEHAGDHLKSALNNLVGEVASSGGDEVIQEIEQQRGELLTGTGKPRGEYLQLEKDQQQLQEEIAVLDDRIRQYQEQVDRLGRLTDEYEKARRERPWDQALRNLERARERYRQVEVLQQQQARDKEALQYVQQSLALLRQNQEQLQSQNRKLQQREADLQKARQQLAREEARAEPLQTAVEQARAVYDAAGKALERARQQEARQRLVQDIARLQAQHQSLSLSLEKAGEFQRKLDEARKQKQQNRIDGGTVQQLRKTRRELDEETIRSRAIATRLSWELDPGKSLRLNGQQISEQGEERLLEDSTLSIPGFGSLGITPGGEDLARARRSLQRLEQRLSDELAALGVASLEEAEQRLVRFQEADRQLNHLEDLLKSVAPNGIDRLTSEYDDTGIELEKRRVEQAGLPSTPGPEAETAPGKTEAESTVRHAEAALTNAEDARTRHEKSVLTARQDCDNARREWQQLKDELEGTERQQQLQQLAGELAAAEQRKAGLEGTLQERDHEIQRTRPDLIRLDIERYQRAAETQQQAQQNRERELRDIRVRLEAWGAEGLEEQRNDKAAELEHHHRRYQELHRRARALDLLLNLLTEKRQALTRRLQAPLQKHLDHYLSVLFPDATLEVDENLMPGRFTRGNELGQMSELSFGAREQMGLISRLAYADLLLEAGRPTLIILDDTLVHSDMGRLEGMKRILFDAARRHQILLFTCHPEHWQDLGVEPRDLEALKGQTVSG
ncbi:DNA repair exonuclease SbcCD ATPase subunit [Marinobacter daqiaonensis]|uniref:DNA repair exonuclease SbcCD ATPase subunit n=1 Tax=Marinobacter daqiaonensis TaxID=650891 RepID=A0A1I6JDE7_9GAMM|nr:AAA family ATPase [Marinobacter daqiaonensis]SFR76996.1 DNA repair exonuclease SbcCD ATPase subunit [Marinobacter daqiaonensis]